MTEQEQLLIENLPRILEYAENRIGKESVKSQEYVECPAYATEAHHPYCTDCDFCHGTGKVFRYQAETLIDISWHVYGIRLRLNEIHSSIGAEEAQEIVETWDETVVADIRDYLGDYSYLMDDERMREAFFAGMNYAERYEKKFGGK